MLSIPCNPANHANLDEPAALARTTLLTQVWNSISPEFYATFWSLSMYSSHSTT